ncbi:hypothetical protein [Phenylobacterium sp.]|uniref:5' nucleotidase, NT5C type n=1 Tax=Phenylobacterium sp. TaxID=1871053 RepID=UPI0025E2067D|nr:hypothetical protein [Phenylobacterium sp.]
MRRQIYLDCDGVLADFDRGAAAVLGMPPRAFEAKYGIKEFWRRLARAPGFFETLDVLPGAVTLYEAVRDRDPIILTGLPLGRWAAPQKRAWAERHFPGVPMITTSAALKREHCHPGDVLVDDREKYRHLWEAAGGVFVHHKDARSSIRQLRALGYID